MKSDFYDLKGQVLRRNEINNKLFEYLDGKFDNMGKKIYKDCKLNFRELLWISQAFLATGNPNAVIKANSIISCNKSNEYELFGMLTISSILLKYENLLTSDNIKYMYDYIHTYADKALSISQDFTGVNDNFPCMSLAECFLLSKLLCREDLFKAGKRKMLQLKKLLTRRGVVSEFASPTYTAIQIHAIAEAVEFTTGDVKKELLNIEYRMWFDVLARYHQSTCSMAGPYSRAYTVDSTGNSHNIRALYYCLFGGKMAITPMNTQFLNENAADGEIIHASAEFMQINTSDIVNATYHCPSYLVEELLNKTYPFEFKTTMEISSSTEEKVDRTYLAPSIDNNLYEYRANNGITFTYMTEKYAMGVSTIPFHNGVHSDCFHLIYNKDNSVTPQEQSRTVYAKYSVNEEHPVVDKHFDDKGRKVGVMDKNSALILYKPKANLCNNVSSLKLSLCFLSQYNCVDELYVGNTKVGCYDFDKEGLEQIFVNDGGVYMCFTPIVNSYNNGKYKTSVKFEDNFMTVSFYNYYGEETSFSPCKMLMFGNGFGAEIRQANEFDSFEAFINKMSNPIISDVYKSNEHTRYTFSRRCSYQNNGSSLSIEYSPLSEGIRYMTINGRAPLVDRISVSDFDKDRLPYIK